MSGFTFGTPATTTAFGTTGFSFGSVVSTAQGSGLSVGSAATTTASPFSFGLHPSSKPLGIFGTGQSATSAAGMGTQGAPNTLGFPTFGVSTTAATAATQAGGLFDFGLQSAKTTPTLPVTQTTVTPSSTTGSVGLPLFVFPTTTKPTAPFTGFGLPASTATTAAAPATGSTFSFGSFTGGNTPAQGSTQAAPNPLPTTQTSATTVSFVAFPTPTVTTQSSGPPAFGSVANLLFKPTTTTSSTVTNLFGALGTATGVVTASQPIVGQVLDKSSTSVSSSSATTKLGFPLANTTSISPFFGKATTAITTTASTAASATSFTFPSLASTSIATSVTTTTTSSIAGNATSVGLPSLIGSSGALPSASSTVAVTTTVGGLQTATAEKSSVMTYHQLEDLINKWSHELEEQERYFLDEADRINQWDQALLTNAEKITSLYDKVDACKTEQTQLEQELDFIEGQQRELECLLEPMERASNELPPGQIHSDFEREATFQLAANVDMELGQMLTDLKEVADQVNATSGRLFDHNGGTVTASLNSNSEDKTVGSDVKLTGRSVRSDGSTAIRNVTRILNCHMHSLNWIHQNTQELMERIKLLETQ